MDCHDDSKSLVKAEDEKKGRGHGGHMLMMVLCCGLPILALAAVPFVVQFNPGLGKFLGSYSWLICPILMVPMMFMMMGNHKKDHS